MRVGCTIGCNTVASRTGRGRGNASRPDPLTARVAARQSAFHDGVAFDAPRVPALGGTDAPKWCLPKPQYPSSQCRASVNGTVVVSFESMPVNTMAPASQNRMVALWVAPTSGEKCGYHGNRSGRAAWDQVVSNATRFRPCATIAPRMMSSDSALLHLRVLVARRDLPVPVDVSESPLMAGAALVRV